VKVGLKVAFAGPPSRGLISFYEFDGWYMGRGWYEQKKAIEFIIACA